MEQEKRKVSVLFMLFGTLFCVCLITANVLETKQLSFGPVNLTAGIIVFPVSYIINDVVCEVWGYARTRMLIWMGFAMNFFFVIMGGIADWIPGAPYWHGEEGFHTVFGLAPRIAAASFIAFIAGSFINAYVMSRMKLSAKDSGAYKTNFSARAILSTVFGELTDSIIFFPLALGGICLTVSGKGCHIHFGQHTHKLHLLGEPSPLLLRLRLQPLRTGWRFLFRTRLLVIQFPFARIALQLLDRCWRGLSSSGRHLRHLLPPIQ